MNKILVVSYHFPPSMAPGAVRPSKFVRYFPEFGWEPSVLTIDTEPPPSPEISSNIYRVREWPHPLKARERWKEKRFVHASEADAAARKWTVSYDEASQPSQLKGVAELKRWLAAFLWFPDREAGWIIPAVVRGLHLIRKKGIDCILSTGPPHSCHLVGLVLKRLTGVRWVADFRDPWSIQQKFAMFRNSITDSVESRMIGSVMKHADHVLSVTTPMTELAIKEHRDVDADKFRTLSNGFDTQDFANTSSIRSLTGPIIFAYFGTFYYGRTPKPFLRALRSLIDEQAIKQKDVLVKFVGHVALAEGQEVQEIIRDFGMENVVTLVPAVPRAEALRQSMKAHVLLILDERHPLQVPLKFYEALASGAVVFNIGSKGAVAELLAKTGLGIAVDYRNIDEIKLGILECLRRERWGPRWSRPDPWIDPAIQDFNYRNVTGQLVGLLER
jgi:glycosyltransferase involved in cell wall biosynthesis